MEFLDVDGDENSGEATGEVTCPIEGCDYTGQPASVEGHVSSSTDGEHKGETGLSMREAIESQLDEPEQDGAGGAEPALESPDVEEDVEAEAAMFALSGVLLLLAVGWLVLRSRATSESASSQPDDLEEPADEAAAGLVS